MAGGEDEVHPPRRGPLQPGHHQGQGVQGVPVVAEVGVGPGRQRQEGPLGPGQGGVTGGEQGPDGGGDVFPALA